MYDPLRCNFPKALLIQHECAFHLCCLRICNNIARIGLGLRGNSRRDGNYVFPTGLYRKRGYAKSVAINTEMAIPIIFSFSELLLINGLFLNNPYDTVKWLQN